MRSERRKFMESRRNRGRVVLALALALLLIGATALGAQEGPPPPPEGLVFSGSVITGLRYRSYAGGSENVFDIDAGDDYLVEGDTASLRGTLNKGAYGATFALSLNANNSFAGMWTTGAVYVSEVNLWGKFLDNKLQAKAGYYGDFDYFTPVGAFSLAGGAASNALQLTAYPIEGLQIDVRTKNLHTGNATPPVFPFTPNVWYEGEQFLRNIDVGVKYVNPNFTVFVAFDDDYTRDAGLGPLMRSNNNQTDVFGYFAFTGVPKLSVGVESKFLDLTSERPDPADATKDMGITIQTALNASYQITDAFSLRAWVIAGMDDAGLSGLMVANQLLGADGFTFAVDLEGTYKINDALTFSLRPIFIIPDTEKADIFNISVKPKLAWAVAAFPYAATINFWYMLKVFGENGDAYAANGNEALNHSIAATFGWTF
jgi:hypothetical protein